MEIASTQASDGAGLLSLRLRTTPLASVQLRREVSSGVMEEDRVEALIGMLSLRFPSVVGKRTHAAAVDVGG